MDENQLIEDAVLFLRHLRDAHRDEPMGELARLVIDEIRPARMAFDSAGRLQRLYSDISKSFAEEAAKLSDKDIDGDDDGYKRCLKDLRKCERQGIDKKICWAMFVLCVKAQMGRP